MRVVRQLDVKSWSVFTDNHPHGTIFQTPEMYRVYEYTRNFEPILFAALDDDDSIVGVLVAVVQRERRGMIGDLTARSVVWGGPVVKNDNEDVCHLLLLEYEKVAQTRALYSQFRNLRDMQKLKHVFEAHGYIYKDHLNIYIDLTKPETELWEQIHSKRRNEIRRATKVGTYVQELKQREQIICAYNILQDVYHNAKLPIADRTMFLSAYDILRARSMVRYFGAFFNDEMIGVVCILAYKNALYNWYAGSMRKHYNKHPNDLLPWEILRWGRYRGYTLFDFGGAGKPHRKYGVRDYKKQFGGTMVNLGRFERIHQPGRLSIARTGFRLWQMLRA